MDGGGILALSSSHSAQTPDRAPWLWMAGLALFIIATRLWISEAVSWDQNEQLVWSQELAWGYGPQPPLYTWLQWAVNWVLGPTTLAVVLVKNTLLALTFAFMYLAARQVLPARTAWLAAAGLTWLPGIGWQLLRDQTHTVMLTCAIACTWWLVLRHIRRPRPMGFVWIGLVVTWGLLSKYSYLVVVFAMVAAALTVPTPRRALLSAGWWLAPLISLALVLPHAWWVLMHWQDASSSTLDLLHPAKTPSRLAGLATGLRDLVGFMALAALPWLVLCWGSFGKFWKVPASADNTDNAAVPDWALPFINRYVAMVAVALALVVLAGASKLDGRWIQPLLLIVPLWALVRWPQLGNQRRGVRRYLLACLALLLLVWGIALYAPLRDAHRGEGDRLNWQMAPIAKTLREAGFDGHGLVIAEHHTTGGVVRLIFPKAHVVVCDALLLDTAPGCIARARAQARDRHQMVLQIRTDDPVSAIWWYAAYADPNTPLTTLALLPYHRTDPAKAQLPMEFTITPAQ